MSNYDYLKPLVDEQRRAADPAELVWLSASAGTGKTQVLSARVLRLLLRADVKPETILCLTFTKAGAAEMAERINSRLAHWVMATGPEIASDLRSLGEKFDPEMVARARTLFASVLDARGGGLRIATIHSFCQTLLGSFPAEAGLAPGFALIEARQEAALPMKILSEMAVAAEHQGRIGFGEQLQRLGHLLDEDKVLGLLVRCAKAADAIETLPSGDGLAPFIRRTLCDGVDDVHGWLAARVNLIDVIRDDLDVMTAYNIGWGTKTGLDRNLLITDWLAKSVAGRIAGLAAFEGAWVTKARTLHKVVPKPVADDYAGLCARLHLWCGALVEMQIRARQADEFALLLDVGREFSRAYAGAKRAAGLVDYDDLIRKTVALLQTPGMGEWIGYKLDQATDHILIDEAQDTNNAQWDIIKAISAEFFTGRGARGAAHRTLFTVGDYKQAIFGFQGTDPRHFAAAQDYFSQAAQAVERDLLDLSLSRSFRSSAPVLNLVDTLITQLGYQAFGLQSAPPPHVSANGGGGVVTLLPPVIDVGVSEDGEDEDGQIPDSVRKLAQNIADQVRGWIDERLWVEKYARVIEPQDVLILVRSRGALASLLVARLNAVGVPVAGVDRLQLRVPIAVKDLLACVRFVLQPLDDLNLGALLVSPLIGWSQDQLFEHSYGRAGKRLWPHLRQTLTPNQLTPLFALLKSADTSTPYHFFETILSGPLDGRRKLLSRLGAEARDPIEELLNAALEFARNNPPSLQIFLDWLDRSDVEIKRDASAAVNMVRVMTVHGAKGLQAPIVILADATARPSVPKGGDPLDWLANEALRLPLFRPRKDELMASLKASADLADEADAREHWRLLYVALTRAEERLVIGGALGPKAKNEVPQGSWYQAVDTALMAMGVVSVEGRKEYAIAGIKNIKPPKPVDRVAFEAKPDWLNAAAPAEARPPRPLAPSSLGKDDVSAPPPERAVQDAAQRGRLLHALFERLPAVTPQNRVAVAARWLEHGAGVSDDVVRRNLISDALKVINNPDYGALFGPDALAEAPIAGVVGGTVIAGTVDRLLISDDLILVVDFKTGRKVPQLVESCPAPHLRQMAAYHDLLASIFPGRPVKAALLYTAGPKLHILSEEIIHQHKISLGMP